MHAVHVISNLFRRFREYAFWTIILVNIFQMGANNSALTDGEDTEKVFQNEVPISV